MLTLQQFSKIQFCLGKPLSVTINKSAQIPSYILHLQFSESLLFSHPKPHYVSSAQLTVRHTAQELAETAYLLCVVNFPRKQIGKIMSDCLTTGVLDDHESDLSKRREGTVGVSVLYSPNLAESLKPGMRVHIDGRDEVLSTNDRNLDWDDFLQLEIRVGTLFDADGHVDVGSRHGIKRCKSAVGFEACIGKQVLVVLNVDEGPWVMTAGKIGVISPIQKVQNGFRLG